MNARLKSRDYICADYILRQLEHTFEEFRSGASKHMFAEIDGVGLGSKGASTMRRFSAVFAALACAVALGTFVTPAAACNAGHSLHPWSAQIGGFFPSDQNARNLGGDTQWSFGLSYDWCGTRGVELPIFSGFLDYTTGSKNSDYLHNFGWGVAARSTDQSYFGGSLGLYNSSGHIDLGTFGSVTRSKSGLGGSVFVGTNLSPLPQSGGGFIEASYRFLPTYNNIKPSGLGLSIGYRF